jgi:hypothetical protein
MQNKKMKSNYFNIVFVLFLIALNSNAQSTGYMGKRLVLNYGFHTSPVSFGSSANNTTLIGTSGSAESGVFALNMIHEGSLEFAMSSKWMMNFSARYYKTVYDNAEYLDYNTYDPLSGDRYSYSGQPAGYYDITGLSYTLYFKYFGSRYVAPWGRYVMFGPVLNTVKTSYNPTVMYLKDDYNYNNVSNTIIKDFGDFEQKYNGFNIMLGWGRSRIIGNRIVIDYGCNTQILSVIMGALNVVLDGAPDDLFREKTTNLNYIENTHKTRVRGINRFNVFLKVGVLLF